MLIIVLITRTIIGLIELVILKILENKNKSSIDNYIKLLIIFLINSSILNYKRNIFIYIIPITTIILIREMFIVIYNENKKVKNLFEKDPIPIIKNGEIVYKNLFSNGYTISKLVNKLKEKNIYSLENIKYCFLNNNKIYIIKEEIDDAVIIDNKINELAIRNLNIDKKTITNILKKEHININDIDYGIYKDKKIYIIRKKDKKIT